MKRTGRLRRGLRAVGLVVALAALTGAVYQALATRADLRGQPPPGMLVDVGGHRLHIWCAGEGSPTVVLETGLGGSSVDWGAVQPGVATLTRVCSYDRAGMGYSDAGPSPRTSGRVATELHGLLKGHGIRDRVVLVGASVGAWSVRLFANAHSDRVAGVVLVDPRHEDQGARLTAAGAAETPPWFRAATRLAPAVAYLGIPRILGASPGTPLDLLDPSVRAFARATRFRASALVATADELRHAPESIAELRALRSRLTQPLVIVSAGQRATLAVAKVHEELQRDHLRLSARSCQVVAQRSGHAVALGQPEIVVAAIRAVVAAARSGTAPDCDAIAAGERGGATE